MPSSGQKVAELTQNPKAKIHSSYNFFNVIDIKCVEFYFFLTFFSGFLQFKKLSINQGNVYFFILTEEFKCTKVRVCPVEVGCRGGGGA